MGDSAQDKPQNNNAVRFEGQNENEEGGNVVVEIAASLEDRSSKLIRRVIFFVFLCHFWTFAI